jgi:hypothetical protein
MRTTFNLHSVNENIINCGVAVVTNIGGHQFEFPFMSSFLGYIDPKVLVQDDHGSSECVGS